MQVIRTRSLASRLRRLVIWAVVFLGVIFIAAVMNEAKALEPDVVPEDVQKLGKDLQTVHVGQCERPGGPMNCVVGIHPSNTYGLMLLFDQGGVLVKVIYLDNVRQSESTLWTHKDYGS